MISLVQILIFFEDLFLTVYLFLSGQYFQFTHPRKPFKLPDLTGKVAIVTGANVGIGYWTVKRLAERGARVFLACRSEQKGLEAVNSLKKELGQSAAIEFLQLDLSDFRSVKHFAESFLNLKVPLHILINNAGIMATPYGTIENGRIEQQLGVNHVGHFLLTHLLLPKLKESAPARIIHVSSWCHYGGRIRFDDLLQEKAYGPFVAYTQSKLANVLFSHELAEKLRGTGVTSNSLHPGNIATEILRHMFPDTPFFNKLKGIVFRTAEEGSDTSVFLAAAPEVEGITGKFWIECEQFETNKVVNDANVRRKLWEVSEKYVQNYL